MLVAFDTAFGGLTLPAKPYLDAVREALCIGKSQIQDVDGHDVNVVATRENGVVTVEVAGERTHAVFTDVLDILLQDDDRLTRAVLSQDRMWLDEPEPALSREIDKLLGVPEHSERVLAATTLRDRTVRAFYTRLEERLAAGQAISFQDCSPPTAVSLASHLRLGDSAPFDQCLTQAANALLAEYSFDEAFTRLSGIPSPLPEPLLASFDALDTLEQLTTLQRWSAARPSPITRLHLVRMASRVASGAQAEAETILQLQATVAEAQAGEFAAFVALLGAISERSVAWQDIEHLELADRIAVCWYHTGRIFRVLRDAVPDVTERTKFAERHGGVAMQTLFSNDVRRTADVACSRYMTEERLLGWGLSYALDGRASEPSLALLRPYLVGIFTYQANGTVLPAAWLLQDYTLKPNCMGSFFGSDIAPFVGAVLEADLRQPLSSSAQKALTAEALTSIADGNPGGWRLVTAIVGHAALYPDLLDGFCRAVSASWIGGDMDTPDRQLAILRFVCLQSALISDERLRALAAGRFVAVAPSILRSGLSGGDAGIRLQAILRAAIDVSRTSDGNPNMLHFAQSTGGIVNAAPETIDLLRRFLTQACYQIPLRQSEALWPLLLKLRSA